jgi:hypothetical protein
VGQAEIQFPDERVFFRGGFCQPLGAEGQEKLTAPAMEKTSEGKEGSKNTEAKVDARGK